jgi:DNA polymerase-3 subunit epsilon
MTLSARQDALQRAREWAASQPVFLDTETTGLTANDTVIEIAIVDYQGQVLFDKLVKPAGKIAPEASRVHHITPEMVKDAPRWDSLWPEIEAILIGRTVVIYNADFDLRLLKQTHSRHWLRWNNPEGSQFVCLMKLYAQYYGQWDSRRGSYRYQSLDNAGKQCGLKLTNTHRAKDDTLLTQSLLHHLANQA